MKRTTNNEPKTIIGKWRQDPKFQEAYEEVSLLVDLAIRVAELRHQKKLSQADLAKLTKTKQAVISRIETGKENISVKKLAKLAHALGVKVKIIFG